MAPPFTYRTVVGTYTAPDGTAVVGDLRFVPSETVTDAAGNVVVPATPITVTLDAYGQFDVDLLVTDDADVNPTGWTWRVTELFSPQREWEFQLPSSAPSPPSTVQIADLAPVTATDVTYAYATLATVAALDARVTSAEATVAAAQAAAAASAVSAANSAASALLADNYTNRLIMGSM